MQAAEWLRLARCSLWARPPPSPPPRPHCPRRHLPPPTRDSRQRSRNGRRSTPQTPPALAPRPRSPLPPPAPPRVWRPRPRRPPHPPGGSLTSTPARATHTTRTPLRTPRPGTSPRASSKLDRSTAPSSPPHPSPSLRTYCFRFARVASRFLSCFAPTVLAVLFCHASSRFRRVHRSSEAIHTRHTLTPCFASRLGAPHSALGGVSLSTRTDGHSFKASGGCIQNVERTTHVHRPQGTSKTSA